MIADGLVNLYTRDIDAGIRFYRDLLGFTETFRTPKTVNSGQSGPAPSGNPAQLTGKFGGTHRVVRGASLFNRNPHRKGGTQEPPRTQEVTSGGRLPSAEFR